MTNKRIVTAQYEGPPLLPASAEEKTYKKYVENAG